MPYQSVWPDFSLCLRNPRRWNSSLQHFFDTSDVCRVFFYFRCGAICCQIPGNSWRRPAQTAHHLFFGQAESRRLGGLVQREIRNSQSPTSSKLPQLPLFVGPPLLKNRMTRVFCFVCPIVFLRITCTCNLYLFLKPSSQRSISNIECCRSQILHWLAGYVYGSFWGTLEMVVRSPDPSICWCFPTMVVLVFLLSSFLFTFFDWLKFEFKSLL